MPAPTRPTPLRVPLMPLTLAVAALLVAAAATPLRGQDHRKDAAPTPFREYLIRGNYGYAYGIASADLDGDGKPDLTSSDTTNNALYWFANDGKGTFTQLFVQKNEPGWFERHGIGDVDGDGRPDLVVVKNLHSELVWFQNPGKPRSRQPWVRRVIARDFRRAYDVVIADLNGDGKPDVAASAWNGNQWTWFENPGRFGDAGPWPRHPLDANVAETRTIRVADINGDGKADLLGTASGAPLVAWYENPGKGAAGPWKRHTIDDRSARPIHGHPVDLDGDGDLDVVMALGMAAAPGQQNTHQVVWYENVGTPPKQPGHGEAWNKHLIGALDSAFEAVAADLDVDRDLDVVATAWGKSGRLVWFENPGNPRKGPWQLHVLKDKWPNANQVIVVDLNQDGRPDIAAVAERGANELRWWKNEGRAK